MIMFVPYLFPCYELLTGRVLYGHYSDAVTPLPYPNAPRLLTTDLPDFGIYSDKDLFASPTWVIVGGGLGRYTSQKIFLKLKELFIKISVGGIGMPFVIRLYKWLSRVGAGC